MHYFGTQIVFKKTEFIRPRKTEKKKTLEKGNSRCAKGCIMKYAG